MKNSFLISALLLTLFSCNKVKEKAKDTINKGGETVGQTATEFIQGVSKGVDKSMECQILVDASLTSEGLKTGKFTVEKDTAGKNNTVVMYFIFEKDFKKNLSIKVFDKKGLENGRTTLSVSGKSGEAKYMDIKFDPRTDIESKSKIEIK